MKSQPKTQIRKALMTLLLTLVTVSPATLHAALTLNSSDTWIYSTPANGDLIISGDLSVWNRLDLGISVEDPTKSAFQLDFLNTALLPKTGAFDLKDSSAGFIWRDSLNSAARSKMSLDSSNTLKLYKADGTTVGLTLNPNSGITLSDGTQLNGAASLRSTALYDASGNVVASVASDGKVKFTNGISFGSDPNVKLNASNVAALQSTLRNLGYQENPVIGTAIKKIAISNAQVTSAVASGAFLYVVGTFSGRATIGGVSMIGAGSQDGFVAKLNASGSALWVVPIGGTSYDSATSVSVDSSGNILVAGNFYGTMSNLGAANNIPSAGAADGYLVKLSASGAVQWAKPIGGTSYDSAASVSVDSSGNVLVAGTFSGTMSNLEVANNIPSAGSNDGYVAKFSPGGDVQWAKPIGGTSYDIATSVSVDSSGNVLVAGHFSGTMSNLGAANNIPSAGGSDGYVAKFSPSDEVQWVNPIGGTSNDRAASVRVDSSGNVLVAGDFYGTMSNLGVANNSPSAGNQDGYVAKFGASGVFEWAKPIGGTSYDSATSVSVDSSGNVLVAGTFSGTMSNLGAANNIPSAGGNDGYVVKLNASGSPVNALAVGGAGGDSLSGLAIWGTDLYGWGNSGGNFAFGNTRVVPGGFILGMPSALGVVTPAVIPSAPLAWSGSAATGLGSTALGGNAYAEGANSTAFGNGSSTGASSFAAGSGTASGTNSVALGGKAFGTNSVALAGGSASGDGAIAFGGIASGFQSISSGTFSYASGFGSFAGGGSTSGGDSIAKGTLAFSWGKSQTVTGADSQAFGTYSTVSSNASTAFGTQLTLQSLNSFAMGRYNVIQGDPLNWVPTDDLFIIGNGSSTTARSNAITTLKNGQTTLTNQAWKANPNVAPAPENSNAEALVVEGNARLKGKIIIEQAQGDISMGIYE